MNKKVLIGAVGGLLAVGGAAFFVVGSVGAPGGADEPRLERGTEEYYSSDRMTVPLEKVIANPAGTAGKRFVEVTLSVEYRIGEEIEDPVVHWEGKTARVTHEILTLLSRKTVADLEGAENKERLAQELTYAIQEAVFPDKKGRIEAVYYTSFAIQ